MNAPAEKLTRDIKVLVTDLQELLKATTSQSGEKIAAARVRLESALAQAQDTVTVQARNAAEATDHYVHQECLDGDSRFGSGWAADRLAYRAALTSEPSGAAPIRTAGTTYKRNWCR